MKKKKRLFLIGCFEATKKKKGKKKKEKKKKIRKKREN